VRITGAEKSKTALHSRQDSAVTPKMAANAGTYLHAVPACHMNKTRITVCVVHALQLCQPCLNPMKPRLMAQTLMATSRHLPQNNIVSKLSRAQ
jgi:hypothetical protein